MKNKNEQKKYYLGLDVGTDSVGWAATDEQYGLLKFRGEPMWGVHLFEEASLCKERRMVRTSRRRLARRQQRVKLVQEIFAKEIAKVDENFYRRIKESALWREDAQDAHCLFCDSNYTDKEYHLQYPTIHHLIYDLMTNKSPHDIRLVYLACAWLVAHRGHFLSNIPKENIDELKSIENSYNELMDFFEGYSPWKCEAVNFGEIFKKKMSSNEKYRELCKKLFDASKVPNDKKLFHVNDEICYDLESMLKLLCGGTCEARKLFCKEEYAELAKFSLNKSEDELAPILIELGDDSELILRLKKVFDWGILANILSDVSYISERKIKEYEKHKRDLQVLKRLVKKYLPKEYSNVFRDEDKYEAYAKGGTNVQEEFYKYIKKIFDTKIQEKFNSSDLELYKKIEKDMEVGSFCPKQVNSNNRVIPYQIYWDELKRILENASQYFPFLNEKDSDGYITSDKLLSIMEFRIPYFVGPLNRSSKFSWIERKAAGKIYPWNFNDKVDLEKSEQAFIDRMTNTCTYLPEAEVLPKVSLLNEKFQVLNEINALTVNSYRIPVEVKQRLYTEHFMACKKVTKKSIKDFLMCNNFYDKKDLDTLYGIDDKINSSLASHIFFKHLMMTQQLTEAEVEEIIRYATYSSEKARFVEWINKKFPNLSEKDRKYISGFRSKGFARLSKEFLCDIKGEDLRNIGAGRTLSIIDRMWDENLNLMEIFSNRYTYSSEVELITKDYYMENSKSFDEKMNDMYLSNPVKRAITRTFDIISDVVKANGCAPRKIFIEMARGGKPENKGKRTKTRYEQLKELYQNCELEDVKELQNQLENMGDDRDSRLKSEKLFLYYLQLGKSMYSGEPINIEKIWDNTYCDRDHIYPRSKVQDDSLLNNKVLVLSTENGLKGDKYPISGEIRNKMRSWWKLLYDHGFITQEKYNRLIRSTPFSEDEEWGFINRQLVETRQSTKALALLLKEKYPKTEIVYVKAGIVSEFRQKYEMPKSRVVNDLHHAKDAYLNIVVGNVYNERFTHQWYIENRERYNLKIDKIFAYPITIGQRVIWQGNESIAFVKCIVQKKNAIHLTRYAFCRKGKLFDVNPKTASEDLVPRKQNQKFGNLQTTKYGGYNSSKASFFAIVKFYIKGKANVMLIPIELLYADLFCEKEEFAYQYAKETVEKIIKKEIECIEFPLGMRQIKINSVFDFDGLHFCLTGKAQRGKCIILSMNVPLILAYTFEKYIKNLERFSEKIKENPKIKFSEKFDKISFKENEELYDVLQEKLEKSIYRKRLPSPIDTIKNGKKLFLAPRDEKGALLNEAEKMQQQVKCLIKMIAIFGRASTSGCDLRIIGGKERESSLENFSASLKGWKDKYKVVKIIDQSASGLYESSSENLLDLLS